MTRLNISSLRVHNGDFETVPTFVAATNTSSRWIDGTAGGANCQASNYGWFLRVFAATITAQFDTSVKYAGSASMKVSATNGRGEVMTDSVDTPYRVRCIPIEPSTQYTITAKVKTSNITGSGVMLYYREHSASAQTAESGSSLITGTNDWTTVTLQFTSASNSRFLVVGLRVSAAGQLSSGDAWLDDITITTTRSRSAA